MVKLTQPTISSNLLQIAVAADSILLIFPKLAYREGPMIGLLIKSNHNLSWGLIVFVILDAWCTCQRGGESPFF